MAAPEVVGDRGAGDREPRARPASRRRTQILARLEQTATPLGGSASRTRTTATGWSTPAPRPHRPPQHPRAASRRSSARPDRPIRGETASPRRSRGRYDARSSGRSAPSTARGARPCSAPNPSRNRLAPVIPLLPTTIRSERCSSATSRIASAASPCRANVSTSVDARRRVPRRAPLEQRQHVVVRVDHPLQVVGHDHLLAAQPLVGHRLVGADDLQPGAERPRPGRSRARSAVWAVSDPSVPTRIEVNTAGLGELRDRDHHARDARTRRSRPASRSSGAA